MPITSKRSTKARTLQKLQTLLNRGARLEVTGQGSFIWRGTTAVWRNPYDLGATKHGGLLVDLDSKHRIVGVRCDDTGPAWDIMDEEHPEWSNINTWASDLIHRRSATNDRPLPAEVFFANMPEWNSQTQSNRLLKEMAWEQWQARPGMPSLLENMFHPAMNDSLWRLRARQLSDSLSMGIDNETVDDVFIYREVELNSKHLLAWTTAAGLAHSQRHGHEEYTSYGHATVRSTTNERMQETAHEWYIHGDFSLPHVRLGDIFMARLTLPQTPEQAVSVFQSIQPTVQYSKLTPQVRRAAVQRLYDLAMGFDKPMAPDEAYEHVCNRICESTKAMAMFDSKRVQDGLRVMADAWLAPNPQGNDLLQSLCDLTAWRQVLAKNPRQAMDLLEHTARMALQQKQQLVIPADGLLFLNQEPLP